MKFRAVIQLNGTTATGIQVPDAVVESLGSSKRPAVTVTINGYTYRSTVAPRWGSYMLPISAENRAGAGVSAGDEAEIDLELDTAPREVVVPDDFSSALDAAPAAKQFFAGLSYSNKSRFVLSIEGAKTAETRQRRIEKAVLDLQEGKA